MLIENQIIRKKWTRQNKEWYVSKGYIFTNYGDCFDVKAEDLSKGAHDKVKVMCDYCGRIVDVVWRDYIHHHEGGTYACKKCRQTKTSQKTLLQRQEKMYNEIVRLCDEKGYILLTRKEELTTVNSEVVYICPLHGIQRTKVVIMFCGHFCPQCAIEQNAQKHRRDPDVVEQIVRSFGGILLNKEDYTDCMKKNLRIICPSCGAIFITSLYAYTKHGGQRCPTCSATESKGEYIIRSFLDMYQIENIPQFRFDDCKYKATLPFDFYLPKYNTLIEYDGQFHYMPIEIDGSPEEALKRFNETQIRDNIKTQYCAQNGIELLRIPYYDFDKINMILYNNFVI